MRIGSLQQDGAVNTAVCIRQTTNALERLRGLLGGPEPDATEGLWITHCNSVHTFFMRYAIDVVFVDARGVVCKVCSHLGPWTLRACLPAVAALEFRAGEAAVLGIAAGTQLQFLSRGQE